jgi:hypothetical protein
MAAIGLRLEDRGQMSAQPLARETASLIEKETLWLTAELAACGPVGERRERKF